MFYFHQRQKYTNNPSTISNFIRKLYPDTPLAEVFIKVSQWEAIPLCPYCDDRERALKSMRNGFRRTCNHPDCVQRMRDEDNNRIGAVKEYKYVWGYLLDPSKEPAPKPAPKKPKKEKDVRVCQCCGDEFLGNDANKKVFICCSAKCISTMRFGYNGGYSRAACIHKLTKYTNQMGDEHEAFTSLIEETGHTHQEMYDMIYNQQEIRYDVYTDPKEIHNNFMLLLKDYDGDVERTIRHYRRHIKDSGEMTHVKGFGKKNRPIKGLELVWADEYGEYIPISNNRATLSHYIEHTIGVDEKDVERFMLEMLPEKIHRCLECNALVKISYSNHTPSRDQNTFCCREHYDIYREKNYNSYFFFTEEQKEKASKRMKKAIREGTFTPNCTNSWTNSEPIIIDGKKYKSSWESLYKRLNGDSIEYETIRIPYVGKTGKSHSYIVDFHDVETDTLYEIKPKSQLSRELNVIKVEAAREWAAERGMTYVIVTEEWFKDNIDRLHALCYDELDRKEVNAINKFQKEIDNEQRRSENQKH